MNAKAWLDIYDETQYRDGDWNVHIIAEVMRALLEDNIKLTNEMEELARLAASTRELRYILTLPWQEGHVTDAERAILEAYEALSKELRDKIA